MERKLSRRKFLRNTAIGSAAVGLMSSLSDSALWGVPPPPPLIPIERRPLGKTGEKVTILGLGGVFLVQNIGFADAVAIVNKAIDLGINYIDTAAQYGEGESERRVGEVMKTRRKEVFLATKVLMRTKGEAEAQFENSLRNLQTDHVDLLQIHAINTMSELEQVLGADGSLEAALEAKAAGKTRFIGITGHSRYWVLTEALKRFPFDTVLCPLSAADHNLLSFEQFLPVAEEQKVGLIGMKVLGEGRLVSLGVENCLRYTLSLPISVAILGMNSVKEVEENVDIAKRFAPMNAQEKAEFRSQAQPFGNAGTLWWKANVWDEPTKAVTPKAKRVSVWVKIKE